MSRLHAALRTVLVEDPTAIEKLRRTEALRIGALLEANHLEPLLYRRVKDSGTESLLSAERLASWKTAWVLSVGRSLAYADALEEIIEVAARIPTPVKLLRGTHLSFFAYQSPELRPLADLDIQTPPESAVPLHCALRRRRFFEMETDDAGRGHRLRCLARDGVTVRIHRLSGAEPAPWDAFSDSARNLSRPRLLRPEPLFVHIAAHAASKNFCHSLMDVHDLLVVAETLAPDWDRVASLAREANMGLETWLALGLLDEILGFRPPSEAARELQGLGGWDASRRDLLAKLSRTSVTLYPASWRLSEFVARLRSEAHASSGAVRSSY